jgi:hypothetical protein
MQGSGISKRRTLWPGNFFVLPSGRAAGRGNAERRGSATNKKTKKDKEMSIPNIHTPGKMVETVDNTSTITRVGDGQQLGLNEVIHTDLVYNAMLNAANTMEERLAISLKTYQEHPDVQANLQQLQYDLQMWNLALTTMTNINKNMSDALNSIASNFR